MGMKPNIKEIYCPMMPGQGHWDKGNLEGQNQTEF
jgi:hypothetical protein